MRSSRPSSIALLLAALAAMPAAFRPASAQTDTVRAQGIAELVEVRATVVAVNLNQRLVTLKGPERTVTVCVDKRIPYLSQVKAGDEVDVRYYEALAVDIDEPGTARPSVEVKDGVALATAAGSGATVATRQVKLTTEIYVVNRGDNSVTFRGPDGYYRWVKIKNPRLQPYLKKLKYGDDVVFTYTEALAVGLEPAKKRG
jgi:hypothetical protein